jgi:hypothetical protein
MTHAELLFDIVFALGLLEYGACLLIWRRVLRPACLYKGDSAVHMDRRGTFLEAGWYPSTVRRWLLAARLLFVFAPATLIVAVLLLLD